MADNVNVSEGSGKVVATDDVSGVQFQRVKLDIGADGVSTPVTDLATSAKQPSLGTAGTPSSNVITVQGITSMTALKTDGSGVTQPVSGTFWQATQPVSLASVPSHAVTNAGTFAVQAAQSGTWNVGTVTAVTGITNALPAGNNNIGDVDVASIAAGTNNIGQVSVAPQTANGLTTYHLVSANTTNATVVKNGAGQLYGYYLYNANAQARKVAFHNSSSTPTAGASVFFSVVIPGGSAANVEFTNGIAFSSGIGITTVTELADSGTTAVAAGDLLINLFYK